MKQPPTDICPLIDNQCLKDRCAWWDYVSSGCAVASIAIGLADAAAELEEREAHGR